MNDVDFPDQFFIIKTSSSDKPNCEIIFSYFLFFRFQFYLFIGEIRVFLFQLQSLLLLLFLLILAQSKREFALVSVTIKSLLIRTRNYIVNFDTVVSDSRINPLLPVRESSLLKDLVVT